MTGCLGHLKKREIPIMPINLDWIFCCFFLANKVNVTMLAADAYGPVDFYQLTLRPSSHDL